MGGMALGEITHFDFFDVDVTFGLSSNQPFINDLHIVGRLWSTLILDKNGKLDEFGIYQHFIITLVSSIVAVKLVIWSFSEDSDTIFHFSWSKFFFFRSILAYSGSIFE